MTYCDWEERREKYRSSCHERKIKLSITHFETINQNLTVNTIWATDQTHFKFTVSKGMMTPASSQTSGTYRHFFKMPREQKGF